MPNQKRGLVTRTLIKIFWFRIPQKVGFFSETFAAAMIDGLYLLAWKLWAAFAPPLCFLSGLLIGWHHFGFENTVIYTSSIFTIGLMISVAGLTSSHGTWLFLGYIFGDFILYDRSYLTGSFFENLIEIRLPLILSYLLLMQLLIYIPLAAQNLRRVTLPKLEVGEQVIGIVITPVEAFLQAFLMGGLTFIWVQAIPVLIRPIFTWQGSSPSREAIAPLQNSGHFLIIIAIITGFIRVLLENKALQNSKVRRQITQCKEVIHQVESGFLIPLWLSIPLQALLTSFLLSGILSSTVEGLILFLAISVFLSLRYLIATKGKAWTKFIENAPLVIRFITFISINYFLAGKMITPQSANSSTFQPILLSVIFSLMMFTLLMPDIGSYVHPTKEQA